MPNSMRPPRALSLGWPLRRPSPIIPLAASKSNREERVAKATIGFIGGRRMGQPMASRLIAAGHPVVAYDIQGQALSAIANKGAKPAASPAEVASQTEIVM